MDSVSSALHPDISVAHIILLILSQVGRARFKNLIGHPSVRLLGAERSENSFYTALARLKRRRMIVRSLDREYELTQAGEYAALKAYIRKEFIAEERLGDKALNTEGGRGVVSKKPWDGRWRMILFDVPESKRPLRDYLRGVLKRAGFKELQRSLWVLPYRIPSFIEKLIADPQVCKYARTLVGNDFNFDEDLRRQFKLRI